jgi:polar amino acid transport system substrate-binding protein
MLNDCMSGRVGIQLRAVCTALGLGTLAAAPSWAQCSRPIIVPAAPTGFNVRVVDDVVSGVYPDWLREVGRRAGCSFQFPVVPRARADFMVFASSQADILLPASQNAERDQKAQFLHFVSLTPSLITLNATPHVPKDLRSLVTQTKWRAAMVRTYSWGDEYDKLVHDLSADNRLEYVSDLETIGRLLRLGRVEFTILPPTLLYSALRGVGSTVQSGEFRYTALNGLPRSRVGAYLSRQTLSPADVELLSSATAKASRDGTLKHFFEKYYPPEIVNADVNTN